MFDNGMKVQIFDFNPTTASRELQAATGMSQSTVSRRLSRMGDGVVQFQRGRTTWYAATCMAFGAGNKIPLGLVDGAGDVSVVAYLRPLAGGGFFC